MLTGEGFLALRDGREIPLKYQFASDYDNMRVGYLLFDASRLDAGSLIDQMNVRCKDGTSIVVAVTHSSDKYLAVTGRVRS